jgi:hypothetical protein
MASELDEGDLVTAKKELQAGWFSYVDEGTRGVVTGTPGWFSDTYTVHFNTGDDVECKRKHLSKGWK